MVSTHDALDSKSKIAAAHNNIGNSLHRQGSLEEAVTSFQKALSIKPEFAVAHYNLGNLFAELERRDEAMASYEMALSFKPDFAEVYYNLHTLLIDPSNMHPSINCMENAVNINPHRADYRFFLGMLLEYAGRPREATSHFDMVENGSTSDRANLDAWRYLKSANRKMPPIIGSRGQAFEIGANASFDDGLILEFGVGFGASIRLIGALLKKEVHGFDSFEGLPEAWHGEPKGSYSTKGEIPIVPENVILHKGWFEHTLPHFIEENSAPVRFINIDCDIYSATKYVLESLAKQIIPGTIIAFDEYIGNEYWREDEFKAFQELVLELDWKYEYLCFSFMTKQVVVRLI